MEQVGLGSFWCHFGVSCLAPGSCKKTGSGRPVGSAFLLEDVCPVDLGSEDPEYVGERRKGQIADSVGAWMARLFLISRGSPCLTPFPHPFSPPAGLSVPLRWGDNEGVGQIPFPHHQPAHLAGVLCLHPPVTQQGWGPPLA